MLISEQLPRNQNVLHKFLKCSDHVTQLGTRVLHLNLVCYFKQGDSFTLSYCVRGDHEAQQLSLQTLASTAAYKKWVF